MATVKSQDVQIHGFLQSGQGTSTQIAQRLDFDASPSLSAKAESTQPNAAPAAWATGLSIALAIVVVLIAWTLARSLARRTAFIHEKQNALNVSWKHSAFPNLVSICVSTYLGLNVIFGGLTALLLNGNAEDSDAYFTEISAMKLARLSHEHFFGYGLMFGTLGILGFVFVGDRKRIVFPFLLAMGFTTLDVASWWLSRFVNLGFHNLSYITGGMFSAAFLALYFQIVFANFKNLRLPS